MQSVTQTDPFYQKHQFSKCIRHELENYVPHPPTVYTQVYTFMSMHANTHTHTHTLTHIRTRTHTHTHTGPFLIVFTSPLEPQFTVLRSRVHAVQFNSRIATPLLHLAPLVHGTCSGRGQQANPESRTLVTPEARLTRPGS